MRAKSHAPREDPAVRALPQMRDHGPVAAAHVEAAAARVGSEVRDPRVQGGVNCFGRQVGFIANHVS